MWWCIRRTWLQAPQFHPELRLASSPHIYWSFVIPPTPKPLHNPYSIQDIPVFLSTATLTEMKWPLKMNECLPFVCRSCRNIQNVHSNNSIRRFRHIGHAQDEKREKSSATRAKHEVGFVSLVYKSRSPEVLLWKQASPECRSRLARTTTEAER